MKAISPYERVKLWRAGKLPKKQYGSKRVRLKIQLAPIVRIDQRINNLGPPRKKKQMYLDPAKKIGRFLWA
ncbi:MAG TPA: hypothetical protein VNX68_06715 [Nitrosopumilaceae archaeon]|jgi:hypothetical protein|nr:hypothetical protein [Nitrosopumilaceae archaeon]